MKEWFVFAEYAGLPTLFTMYGQRTGFERGLHIPGVVGPVGGFYHTGATKMIQHMVKPPEFPERWGKCVLENKLDIGCDRYSFPEHLLLDCVTDSCKCVHGELLV